MSPVRARAVYRRNFRILVLVHVIRGGCRETGDRTFCGRAVRVTAPPAPVILELPCRLPDDGAWCPECVGKLAAYYGLLDEVADMVTAYDPELEDLAGARWWSFVDAERERRRTAMGGGHAG